MDVAKLEDLLREAEGHHGAYEAIAPAHRWSSWYASYISSRMKGNAPERASTDAGLYTSTSPRPSAAQSERMRFG